MRRFWLAPAMLALAVLYAGFDSDSGLRTWKQLRTEREESRLRIAEQRAVIAKLDQAAAELEADPFAMETVIRTEGGLARENETTVVFLDEETSSHRNP